MCGVQDGQPLRTMELWLRGRVAATLERVTGLRATSVEAAHTIVTVSLTQPQLDQLVSRLAADGLRITAILPAIRRSTH